MRPSSDKIEYCLDRAEDALRSAIEADNEIFRAALVRLADTWLEAAAEAKVNC